MCESLYLMIITQFVLKQYELLIIYTTQMTFNRCMCNYSLTLYMPNNVLEMFEDANSNKKM